MKNLWNDKEARDYAGPIGLRIYTSRLLGRDKSLVLHGGGNTSVKVHETNIVGEQEEILYVKGSGIDLEGIDQSGFSPLRMAHLLKLAQLAQLSDAIMSNEMMVHRTQVMAPPPSVEAILHALLPHQYVDHTHADAFISVTNSQRGSARIREIYGDSVVYIPYVMPGFDLARACAELYPKKATSRTVGLALERHGLFSFGATAKQSYERMIALVTKAENYLKARGAWNVSMKPIYRTAKPLRTRISSLRSSVSNAAGFPVIMTSCSENRILSFVNHPKMKTLSQRGPATPDHVIRTKRVPLVGSDVKRYSEQYRAYFERNAALQKHRLVMLDPAPRVILEPEIGMCAVGRDARSAIVVGEIYEHTIGIIERSHKLGGWRALSSRDIFAVEYWELEQAKLGKAKIGAHFTGEIALVTGAASGIGKACVDSLLARGAAVIGLDISPAVISSDRSSAFLGIACDLTKEAEVAAALEKGVHRFGGLDMLVLNAGIFPKGCFIAEMDSKIWRKVMSINLDANLALMRECHPILKMAPRGGRVVVIGSKNVPAPGPGAAAYSASKAAVNQLARIAALEWGKDRIRINSIHPNMVFDTALWTAEVLESRAKQYGLTVEKYKSNNVLRVEVMSRDVAEMTAEMCGPLFSKTTGAQVPVDGGNERVI